MAKTGIEIEKEIQEKERELQSLKKQQEEFRKKGPKFVRWALMLNEAWSGMKRECPEYLPDEMKNITPQRMPRAVNIGKALDMSEQEIHLEKEKVDKFLA